MANALKNADLIKKWMYVFAIELAEGGEGFSSVNVSQTLAEYAAGRYPSLGVHDEEESPMEFAAGAIHGNRCGAALLHLLDMMYTIVGTGSTWSTLDPVNQALAKLAFCNQYRAILVAAVENMAQKVGMSKSKMNYPDSIVASHIEGAITAMQNSGATAAHEGLREVFADFLMELFIDTMVKVYTDRFNDCGECVIMTGQDADAELIFKQVRRTLVGCAGFDPMFAVNPLRGFISGSFLGKIKSLWCTVNKIVVEGINYCKFVVDTWRDRVVYEEEPKVVEVAFENKVPDDQYNYERLSIRWAEYCLESWATWAGHFNKLDLCTDVLVVPIGDNAPPPANIPGLNDPIGVKLSPDDRGIVVLEHSNELKWQ